MNILLLDGLPEEYEGIPLSTDFRNMVQVDLIFHEEDVSETEKIIASLHQLYPEIPKDISKAVRGLEWFYSRGKASSDDVKGGQKGSKASQRAFSFDQDQSLIYAAFYATYSISLTTIDFLHWWEFMALLEGLPETTLIQRVMYWRTADLKDMSKEERKHILKLRKLYALKEVRKKPMSVDELNQQAKDRVVRRFEEAQAAIEESVIDL